MKLLDQFRRNGKLHMPHFVMPSKHSAWREWARITGDLLRERDLPTILIDNVADYYYCGTDQEHWDLSKHFPNIAPPFDRWWMEFRLPKVIHSEIGDTPNPVGDLGGRAGLLTLAFDRSQVNGDEIPENAKWICIMDLFIDYGLRRDGSIEGPHGNINLAIDENGALIDRPWMQSFASKEAEPFMHAVMGWIHPALLAVCFMHCKNVVINDEPMHEKHAKAVARKNNGVQPVRFKTLVIEPLKQILRREGHADTKGVPHAMHICRGHFKDYREGKGLFGKYHKIVWQPMVVRGSKGAKPAPREMEIKV